MAVLARKDITKIKKEYSKQINYIKKKVFENYNKLMNAYFIKRINEVKYIKIQQQILFL